MVSITMQPHIVKNRKHQVYSHGLLWRDLMDSVLRMSHLLTP